MKKAISLFLILTMTASLFLLSGCGQKEDPAKEMYLASDCSTVVTYAKTDDGSIVIASWGI